MALRNPPLAGKPPFATDEPDSSFIQREPQRRTKQRHPADPNSRTSAYDVYDSYLDDSNRNSGIGDLGMGFMNANMDDDDDDDDDVKVSIPVPHTVAQGMPAPARVVKTYPKSPHTATPIAAPRPGYAAPPAVLNLPRPAPVADSGRRPPPSAMTVQVPPAKMLIPSPASTSSSVPSTPHPLRPPISPITPAFARPPKSPVPREKVKFTTMDPIMRGNSEDQLLPKRGEKGDDFWRRFSTIAKEENKKPPTMKKSSWLKKTQSGSNRLSRWVWFVAILLLLCIGGAIGLRIYLTHNQPSHEPPTALGGSANQAASSITTSSSTTAHSVSSSPHVSPTNTVARRAAHPDPFPTSIPLRHRQVHDHLLSRRRIYANSQ